MEDVQQDAVDQHQGTVEDVEKCLVVGHVAVVTLPDFHHPVHVAGEDHGAADVEHEDHRPQLRVHDVRAQAPPMEDDEQGDEAKQGDQLHQDGGPDQVRTDLQLGRVVRVDGLGSAVAGNDADDEIQTNKGRDHAAGMNGRKVWDVVKHSTKNDVVGQGIDGTI